MTPEEVVRVLTEMQATFPQRTLDEGQSLVWNESLAPLDFDAALAALKRLRGESEWMPSHARFLAVVEEERKHLLGKRELAKPDGPCDICGYYIGDGKRWVNDEVVHHEVGNFAFPCPRCRPVQYTRWVQGHFTSDHTCADCTRFRSGSPEQQKELAESYGSQAMEIYRASQQASF